MATIGFIGPSTASADVTRRAALKQRRLLAVWLAPWLLGLTWHFDALFYVYYHLNRLVAMKLLKFTPQNSETRGEYSDSFASLLDRKPSENELTPSTPASTVHYRYSVHWLSKGLFRPEQLQGTAEFYLPLSSYLNLDSTLGPP